MRLRERIEALGLLAVSVFWVFQMMAHIHPLVS